MSVYLPGISQDPSITFGTGNSGANGGTGGGGIPTPGFGGDPDGTLYKDANGTRWNQKGQSWDADKERWVDGKNGPWSLPAGSTDPLPPALYGADGSVTNFAKVAAETAAGGGSIYGDIIRYLIPTAGSVIGGLIQANAAGNASEAQQRYLEEALAYEKEKDKGNIEREGGRYNDYRGNIAPYLATGQAANARMASLLGLSPSANPYGIQAPTAPSAASGAGAAGPATGGTPAPGITTQPQARTTAPPQTQIVPMVGPDGSQQNVPANQVEYWQSKGAKVMGAVA